MSKQDPLLVQTAGGFSLHYDERWLYSRYQPHATAEKMVLDTPVEPDTLYLLISPCLAHGLELLASRLPQSSAVLGIELDASLLAIAKDMVAKLELDPSRFRLCNSTVPGTILAEAAETGKFRRIKEVRLSGGRDLHPREYDRLVETITINNRLAWRNHMTLVKLGRLWVKNVITNLATLPWEQLGPPRIVQKPIMLCGAGPSLNQTLPWIKRNSRHLTIMAVDTAAGALVQAGIEPDWVVCLEAQAHNLPDFTPLTGLEPTLVADISAHPASFRLVKGQKILVSSHWTNSRFLERLSSAGLPIQGVPPLGSVGVLATRLAVQQGQPVFLAGLDFSFQRALTHCKGSPSDLAERRLETRLYKQNRNWALSCSQNVFPTLDGNLGTAILSMYASCAAIELDGAIVYDLRDGFGLPLPATAISLDQAEEFLISRPIPAEQAGNYKPAQDMGRETEQDVAQVKGQGAVFYRAAATAFLENELALARNLALCLRSGSYDQLGRLIQDCDYMYAHFPDPQRVEALEIDALKRLALEAIYWQTRLQTALETI
jgi:hypothetical protein